MNKRNLLLSLLLVIVYVFSLASCSEEPEIQYYIEGVYAPGDGMYKITLPSENWQIEGEENPENITFKNGGNKIKITRKNVEEDKTKDIIKNIPLSQDKLEKQIRDNNIEDYTIDTYKSTINLFDKEAYYITEYIYQNNDDDKYLIRYTVYDNNYFYDFNAVATGEDELAAIKKSIESFIMIDENNTIKIFQLKDEQTISNTYYSKDQDYILNMPYGQWAFEIDDEYYDQIVTYITRENTNITIKKNNKNNIANTIVYEIPTNLDILNKQIKSKGITNYEIIEFKQEDIGILPYQDDAQNYKKFSYLVCIKNDEERKYYAYSEYRTEDDIYILEGNEDTSNIEFAQEMYQIISSFSLAL